MVYGPLQRGEKCRLKGENLVVRYLGQWGDDGFDRLEPPLPYAQVVVVRTGEWRVVAERKPKRVCH